MRVAICYVAPGGQQDMIKHLKGPADVFGPEACTGYGAEAGTWI